MAFTYRAVIGRRHDDEPCISGRTDADKVSRDWDTGSFDASSELTRTWRISITVQSLPPSTGGDAPRLASPYQAQAS
jgi:hypothetical protein